MIPLAMHLLLSMDAFIIFILQHVCKVKTFYMGVWKKSTAALIEPLNYWLCTEHEKEAVFLKIFVKTFQDVGPQNVSGCRLPVFPVNYC